MALARPTDQGTASPDIPIGTFLVWIVAVSLLGFVLGYSGGPAVRRTLATDGAFVGAAFAIIHLAIRATARRLRSTQTPRS